MKAIRGIGVLYGGLLAGMLTAIYTISFTAIVYNGPLSEHLDRGIVLALFGGAVMAGVGAFAFSRSGAVSHAQDITAIMLAASAARVALDPATTPATLFSTVVVLIALAGLMTSVIAMALGSFRLSRWVAIVPYPVVVGFLAATGLLLLFGAVALVSGHQVSISAAHSLLAADTVKVWLPWIAAGLCISVASRRFQGDAIVPLSIAALLLAFWAIVLGTGLGISGAESAGLLLGPFPERVADSIIEDFSFGQIEWMALGRELPALVAIAVMAVLGGMLNLNGLQLATGLRGDSDRDLRAVGLVNGASAISGGLVGYPAISTSYFAWRLGLKGIWSGLSAAAVCIALAVFGVELLSILPKGLFSAIIAYMGFELLYAWGLKEASRFHRSEAAVVVLIPLFAVGFGVLSAVAAGIVLSALIFVVRYAASEHLHSVRRDPVDDAAAGIMADTFPTAARRTVPATSIRLRGYLFFGVVGRLQRVVEQELDCQTRQAQTIVIDLSEVYGLDGSAAKAIAVLCEDMADIDVEIVFKGLDRQSNPAVERTLRSLGLARRIAETCRLEISSVGGGDLAPYRADTRKTSRADTFAKHPDGGVPVVDVR